MPASPLRSRSTSASRDIFKPSAWHLREIFPFYDVERAETAFQSLIDDAIELRDRCTSLAPATSDNDFQDNLGRYEDITSRTKRIGFCSHMLAVSKDEYAETFRERSDAVLAAAGPYVAAFERSWQRLDEPTARRLLDASPHSRYWLGRQRAYAKHLLSDEEEDSILASWNSELILLERQYQSIVEAYPRPPVWDRDRQVREQAFGQRNHLYARDEVQLGTLYEGLVRFWRRRILDACHFASPIARWNLIYDIPDDVVTSLLAVCRDHAHLYLRFCNLLAAHYGVERVNRSDISDPFMQGYPLKQGAELVLACFGRFDPDFKARLRRLFKDRHVQTVSCTGESVETECVSIVPELTPWLQVDYHNSLWSLDSLAHELGHATHSMLASQCTVLEYVPVAPVAEVASHFSELLLADHRLSTIMDAEVRQRFLFHMVRGLLVNTVDSAFRTIFEIGAHEAVWSGATVEELCELYYGILLEQYGGGVVLPDHFRWEWLGVEQMFLDPFVSYAYPFGTLVALVLRGQRRQRPAAFREKYRELLAYGSSASPAHILQQVGVDIHDPVTWLSGFDEIGRLMDELELRL